MNTKYIKINTSDKIYIFKSIGLMLKSGVSLLEAVESIQKQSSKNVKIVLKDLLQSIKQGNTLSDTFKKYPNSFDSVSISIISSAEKSGNLEQTLIDISNDLTKDLDFNQKVKSALIYPSFVLLLSFVIFSVIVFYVIPQVAGVFTKLNVELPLITVILLNLSEFITENIFYISFITLFVIFLTIILYFFKFKLLQRIFFSLPFVSKIIFNLDLIRVTKNIGKLLNSGITIDQSLLLTKEIAYKKHTAELLDNCYKNLNQGSSIFSTIKHDQKLFTGIYKKIIESGEKSSSLADSLIDISNLAQDNLDYTLKRITLLLEPVLIVFLGLFVGGIIISIIGPIYQLISGIGVN